MRNFKPLEYYKWLYKVKEKEYTFKAKNIEEWILWRRNFKSKLVELLGGFDYPKCNLIPETLDVREYDDYLREKVIYQSDEFSTISAYFLLPKNVKRKIPVIIALHGHGYGKDEITGIWEDGSERVKPISKGYQKDFALELVKRGVAVLVPDQCGFGERREEEDIKKGPSTSSCWFLSLWALMFGKTIIGRRVWDVMMSIEYLKNRKEVDSDAVGVIGISGGGTTALFSAAIDDRIKVAVVSGYLCTFKDSILSIRHCIDNYIPGILKYGEMYTVAYLIAPRPLFIEHGTKDKIFPISATKRAYEKIKAVYEFLKVSERVDCDFFEGVHEICGRKSYDFLLTWLKSKYWIRDELYKKSLVNVFE